LIGGDVDTPLEIFFSYAHEDEPLMNDVRRQLIVYERNGRILKWHDRMIPPGAEWRDRIDERLESAQIILLFMSPHFIESQYCYEVEGEAALRRHKAGQARVIPIVLRPCAWDASPFGELEALPADAKPISRWEDCDEACLDAARGVMRVVDEVTKSRPAGKQSSFTGHQASRTQRLKTLRVFAKGHFTFKDTSLDVLWDGKVVGQGSFRKGFNVTINDVSNGLHTVSVRFKSFVFTDPRCQIDPKATTSDILELVHSSVTGHFSWRYVREDD
jgi:hypothetical protein